METKKEKEGKEINIGDMVLLPCEIVKIRENGDYNIKIICNDSTKTFKPHGQPNTIKIINLPPDGITISPNEKKRIE